MKKRLLSVALILCMCMSLLPTTVFAAGEQSGNATVTFRVVNGTWSDGTSDDMTVDVPLDDNKGTLTAEQVPSGMQPADGFEGGAWDVTPATVEGAITENVTYTYSFSKTVEIIEITDISLTGFTKPVYGAHPDFEMSVEEGAHYHFASKQEAEDESYSQAEYINNGIVWQESYVPMDPSDTFTKTSENAYRLSTLLIADEGYQFGNRLNIQFNGDNTVFYGYELLSRGVIIYSPNYTVIDPEAPAATVTFKVENGTWKDGSTDDKSVTVLMNDNKGTLNKKDIPTGMKPVDGFEDGKWDVTPNTDEGGIIENVTYTYSFSKKILINEVSLLGFSEPVIGEHPKYDLVVPEGAHYHLASKQELKDLGYTYGSWTDENSINGMWWMTGELCLTPESTFLEHSGYYARIFLIPDEGYKFAKDELSISVDGNPLMFYEGSINDYRLSFVTPRFMPRSDSPDRPVAITNIELTGFTAPVLGGNPDFTMSIPDDAHYHFGTAEEVEQSHDFLLSNTDNLINGIWWTGFNGAMTPSDIFTSNSDKYYCEVVLFADPGYEFSEVPFITINGTTKLVNRFGAQKSNILISTANYATEPVATNTYTVNFNAGGASGNTPSAIEHVSDKDQYEFIIPDCGELSKENHVFSGWIDEATDNFYIPGETVILDAEHPTLTLTAEWYELPLIKIDIPDAKEGTVPADFHVSFNENDAMVINVPATPVPARDGYEFLGYILTVVKEMPRSIQPTINVFVQPGEEILLTEEYAGAVKYTLTARWKQNEKPVDPEKPENPDDPEKPEKPADPEKPGVPDQVVHTGDNSSMMLWSLLFVTSLSAAAVLALNKKKKHGIR